MPLPGAHGLILLDQRLDKQAVYNAAKAAQKLCEQQKTCLGAGLDVVAGDPAKIIKMIINSGDANDLKKNVGQIFCEVVQTNVADKENSAQLFAVGYLASRNLEKMVKEAEERSAAIKDAVKVAKAIKQAGDRSDRITKNYNDKQVKSIIEQVLTKRNNRPYHLDTLQRGNGCDPDRIGKISNKPPNNFTLFNSTINFNRGGYIEPQSGFFQLLKRSSPYIIGAVVIGSVIYLIFKKRKFFKKFIKLTKNSRIYKIYKKTKNHFVFNNCFSKRLFIFYKVVN